MKKAFVGMLAMGLAASAAQAASLGLRWADAPTSQKISAMPSDTVEVEVYVTLQAGETVAALGFQNEGVDNGGPSDVSNLYQVAASAASPNGLTWSAANSVPDSGAENAEQLGANLQAVALGSVGPANNLSGPFSGVVGSYFIHVGNEPFVPGDEKEITFFFGPDLDSNTSAPSPIPFLDASGGDFSWHAAYNTTGAYSGYVAFGEPTDTVPTWGSPGWNRAATKVLAATSQDRSPLILTKVPEPTTLALLAVGGFALIRRRRTA